jgi:hypothetical protein
VSSAVRRVGGAVILCSFTTTVGYGSLLFNDQQALTSFGKLAMWGEVACIVAAMLVLPSMLHLFNRFFSRRPAAVPADRPSLPPASASH